MATSLFVNSEWSGCSDGDLVFIGDDMYIFGTDAFADIQSAVIAADTDGAVINVMAGTYAGNVDLAASVLGVVKTNMTIQAYENDVVNFNGVFQVGHAGKGSAQEDWNGGLTIDGITFNTDDGAWLKIACAKDVTVKNCTITGGDDIDADYSNYMASVENTPGGSSNILFDNCSFGIGRVNISRANVKDGRGVEFKDCVFTESAVNVQYGYAVAFNSCTFSKTLTDAYYKKWNEKKGEWEARSFYIIRSNDQAIVIDDCSFTIDANNTEYTEPFATGEWAVLWQRGTGSTKWDVSGSTVNYTAAAAEIDGLLFSENATDNDANASSRTTFDGLTAAEGSALTVDELLANTSGYAILLTETGATIYDDGVKKASSSDSNLYADGSWAGSKIGTEVAEGKYFGFNAYESFTAAHDVISDGGTIVLSSDVDGTAVTTSSKNLTIQGTGTTNRNIDLASALQVSGTWTVNSGNVGFERGDWTKGLNIRNTGTLVVTNAATADVGYLILRGDIEITAGATLEVYYGLLYGRKDAENASQITITNAQLVFDANGAGGNLEGHIGGEATAGHGEEGFANVVLSGGTIYANGNTHELHFDHTATLTATGNSKVEAVYKVTNDGLLNLGSTKLIAGTTLTNTGTINITVGGTITAASIDNSAEGASITIDATGLAANSTVKVIDITGEGGFDATKVSVTGARMIQDTDGDIYVTNVAATSLFVNNEWTGTAVGTEVTLKDGTSKATYGINAFDNFKSALAVAQANGAGASTTISFDDMGYTFASAGKAGSHLPKASITTPGTYTLKDGNGALLNYEVEINSGKTYVDDDKKNYVFNIDGAFITLTKLTARVDTSVTIKDSRVDFNAFEGGSAYLSLYNGSTLTISNSTVGFDPHQSGKATPDDLPTAGTGPGAYYNWAPRVVVYGTTRITDSTMFIYVGQGNQTGFDVLGNSDTEVKNSTVSLAQLNVGNTSSELSADRLAPGESMDDLSASLVIDGSTFKNTQYRGDSNTKNGIIVGSATNTAVKGTMTVKNNSLVDFTVLTYGGTDGREVGLQVNNAGSSVVITSGSTVKVPKITNAGTITIDATSLLTGTTLTGAGSITIDATAGLAANTIRKVIDLSQTASLEGKVTLAKAEGDTTTKLVYGADGDVLIHNITATNVYVTTQTASVGETVSISVGGTSVDAIYGINAFGTFKNALENVADNGTITLEDDIVGSELSTEMDYSQNKTITITGNAPDYVIPIVTFRDTSYTNTIVANFTNAAFKAPELDARQNATINVINSTIMAAGGDSIVKSYYNGVINVDANSEVHGHQITTTGRINLNGEAFNTWQVNVLDNGIITINEGGVFHSAQVNIGGVYNRSNPDEDRVGKAATIDVNGGSLVGLDGTHTYHYEAKYFYVGKDAESETKPAQKGLLSVHNHGSVTVTQINGMTVTALGEVDLADYGSLESIITTNSSGNPNSTGTILNGGTITIDATSSLTAEASITNTNAINITVGGTITAASIDNSAEGASIAINASALAANSTVKVIDITGTDGFDATNVTVTGEGVRKLQGKDGDVFVTNETADTYYVNADWSSKEIGETVTTAKGVTAKYGISAFSTFSDAYAAATAHTGREDIYVESNIVDDSFSALADVNVKNGTADGTAVSITNTFNSNWVDGYNALIGEGVTVNLVYIWPNYGELQGSFNIDGSLVFSAQAYVGWEPIVNISATGYLGPGSNETVLRYNKDSASGIYVTGNAELGAEEEDRKLQLEANWFAFYSGTISLKNTRAKSGWLKMNASLDAASYDYKDFLLLDNAFYRVTSSLDMTGDATVDAKNYSTLTLSGGVTVNEGSKVLVDATSAITTTGAFANHGALNITVGGTVTANSFTNDGMITIDVTGFEGVSADIITVTSETGSPIAKTGVTLDGTGAGNFAVITKDNGGVSIVRVGEDVYIWDGCANLPTGTAVSVNGVTAFVGVDAFATLDDALTTAGKTIYFKSNDAPALAITDHLNGSSLLKANDAEADVIVEMGSSDSAANNMLTGDLTIGEGVTFAATKLVHRNTAKETTITVEGTFQSVTNAYLYAGVMNVAATGKLTGDDVFLNGSGGTYELYVTGDGVTEQVDVASLRIGAAATANFTNTIVSADSLSVTAATGMVNASNTTINGDVTNAGTINADEATINGNVTNNGTVNLAADGAVVANGDIVNNGTVNFKEDSRLQADTITNNGTFAIEGTRAELVGAVSNASKIDIAAGKTLAFSGESSLTNDAAGTINVAGTIEAAAVENNGTINVTGDGATFTGDVVSTGTIEVTGTVTVTGAITNNATGAITIDAASSLLSATSIANNGTITIDTTGFTGMKKIIDLDGENQTITGEGTITIDGTAELVYHGEDSSYYLSNVDQSVLYVSNAWSTAVYGQEVETGKFYGINAFSALRGEKGALAVAMPRTADTTITFEGTSFSEAYDDDIMANFSGNVEFKGSPVTLNQTAGGRMDLCVSPAAGTTATISTPITAVSSNSLAGIWLNFTGEGTTKVSSTITAKTYIGINSNVNVDKDATLTTEANLQIGRAKDAIATNATITGTDRTFGADEYQVSAQGIQLNEGTATVTGSKVKANTLSVTDTFAFKTGAYTGAVTLNSKETTWDLASIIVGFYTADAIGGYLTPGASTFNFTDSVINVGAIKNQAYFIPSDDGQIDENRAIEGYALTINLDGTTLKAASILNNGTIALTDSSTATVTGAITGTGTITVDASTLSFGGDFAAGTLTLSNGGTVAAISGDRVLNIGMFTGTITVDDDANLTGSAVDGTGDIEVLSGVTLTLDGKTEEEATSFGAVTNAGTINIDGKRVNLGAIDNSGAINMDWQDMLTFTGFSGSAINFDMSGFNGIEENTMVMDFEGTGTKTAADYQAMLGFDADYLNRYFMVDGNDLYLKGGVSDTIYVHNGETIAHAVGRALDASAIRIVVEDGTFSAPADFGPVITKTSPYYDFTDNMFTGYEVVINDGTFDESAARITGGAVIELTGKRQYVITGGDRSVTINGGEFNGVVVGGDRLTTIGNLTHGNNDKEEEVGVFNASLNLEINGGVFKKNVAGGMMLDIKNDDASVDQYGDINLTINGGTFEKFIYGGNVSSNKGFSSHITVTGDITVTIDTTAGETISINSLCAGSFGEGKVNGSTKVVLKGDGQYMSVADQLWGGCSSDVYFVNSDGTKTANSKVTGTRTLSFEGFSGDLNVKSIKMFSDVKFDAESDVDFTNFRGTMAEVENWEIAFGSENTGAFNNDFAGDSLNLTGLSGALEEPWVIFGNTSKFKNITEEGAGFKTINGSAAVLSDNLLEGEICGYDLGSYTLAFTEASDTTSAQMVLRNAVLS